MKTIYNLAAEWERIDVLVSCLSKHRSGDTISHELKDRLNGLQEAITTLRQQPPWQPFSAHYGLDPLDQDILAFALAPEAEPRLGWRYQELQSSLVAFYPTPALIRELLFMDQTEVPSFNSHLSNGAPLLRWRLVEADTRHSFQPLRPTARATHELLGWRLTSSAPPGAVPLIPQGTWEDLVLPVSSIKALQEFLLWITHRDQVVVQWGAQHSGGPVALFAGPSGTGKTFAAEVLANTLAWPLYRVDLGLLISKYVGETEKNLNALFDTAHGQPMVLLFDEADSLFGKRGEIKEARDRYANMEVSHLLSRIERHQGPCILTSNLRQHLDPAFARRFQTVIEFPWPDASARQQLWQKHLPPRAPLDPKLDLVLVANSVTLTGGQIRNAALHSAYLAAGGSRPIALVHITRAIWAELGKPGREVTRASLGKLADYLPEEVT